MEDTRSVAKIHKAEPADEFAEDAASICVHCHRDIKRVPGGHGPVWVHSVTGAVAGLGTSRTADPTYTRDAITSALNRAANDAQALAGNWPDDGENVVDATNLVVNLAGYYLDHPGAVTIQEAVEESYDPDMATFLLTGESANG